MPVSNPFLKVSNSPLANRPTSYLLSLAKPPTQESSGPSVLLTLPLAEGLHRALIGRAAGGTRIDAPELTGHAINGQPLQGPHRHAYLLPVDLDQDGRLDHVIVHASMGFGSAAQAAIESLRWLRSGETVGFSNSDRMDNDLNMDAARNSLKAGLQHRMENDLRGGSVDWQLSGSGLPKHVLHLPIRVVDRRYQAADESESDRGNLNSGSASSLVGRREFCGQHGLIQRLFGCREEGGGLVWRSVTPLVLPRFLKPRGKNSLEGQIQAELASRGLPMADTVEVLNEIHPRESGFVLNRSMGGKPAPLARGYFVAIRLKAPATGPIVLGYASHFGLGLMARIDG